MAGGSGEAEVVAAMIDEILSDLVARFGYGPTIVVTGSGVFVHLNNTMWWGSDLLDALRKVRRDLGR